MAEIKIGTGQFDTPPPLGYRRFMNAMIIFILPGLTAFINGWGFPDKVANHWMLFLSFVPALIKGIGVLLGNGQEYSPSNKVIDQQNNS